MTASTNFAHYLELGKRLYRGFWSVRPVAGMDFYLNHLDSATETGAGTDTAVAYDKLDMTQVFLRAGLDLRFQRKRLTLNSGLSYSYDVRDPAFRTGVHAANNPALTSWLQGTELGRSIVSVNVGGSDELSKSMAVFGGFDGQAVTDRAGDNFQSVGYVGGSWKW